jgi:formylglycine-generating enzyme required for sulfatase activity
MKRRPAAAAAVGAFAALVVVVVGALVVVAAKLRETEAARQEQLRAERERTGVRLDVLLNGAPGAVPQVLSDLEATREDVLPRLRQVWQDRDAARNQRMRAGLVLLAAEPETVRDELMRWMLTAKDPVEVVLFRDALARQGGELAASLWRQVEDPKVKPAERFRALVGLAAFDPAGERWRKHAGSAVEQMLSANPLYLGTWVKALQPVSAELLTPLTKVYRAATSPERREFAATVLADYAADKPDVLADLLLEADPRQYVVLYPALQHYRAQAVEWMRRAVRGEEVWKEAPLDPSWREVPAELRREIEFADGVLAERWALCQSLPLERWQVVAEEMRRCGYRPVRLRPYPVAASGSLAGSKKPTTGPVVAAVWARDGRDFRTEIGMTAAAIREHDAAQQRDGFIPADIAGHGHHFAALWVKPAHPGEQARLYLDVPATENQKAHDVLKNSGFVPLTVQGRLDADGKARYCGVWWKAGNAPKEWTVTWDDSEDEHRGRVLLAEEVLCDVDVLAGRGSFASVWHGDPERDAAESHGLAPEAHRERCRELALQGYRPVALSVAALDGGKRIAASAWQRPFPRQPARERLARRQATGAVTLLKMDVPADAWALYRHRPDPEARSQLIWRGGLLGLDPAVLVQRLDEEKDVSARRALILALGEFTAEQLPDVIRRPLAEKLLRWYQDDPDPGIHGAIDWLLRHPAEGATPRPLDWGGSARLKEIDEELKKRDRDVASGRRQPPEGRRWYVNGEGQTMVLILGPVEFRMGAPPSDPDRFDSETPHRRLIPRAFAIASRPVTLAEFRDFLKDWPDVTGEFTNRHSPDAGGPTIGLSWFVAAQYCNWLSQKEGLPQSEWCYPRHGDIKEGMKPFSDFLRRKGYRLPTEAEWEYAARAGTLSPRYYGSSLELLPRYGWFITNAGDRTWPVAQKRPNDLGLFDTLGNVWNWVHDPYDAYRSQQGTDPIPDTAFTGNIDDRISSVLRGGSFLIRAAYLRSSSRYVQRPSVRYISFGLRVARTYN